MVRQQPCCGFVGSCISAIAVLLAFAGLSTCAAIPAINGTIAGQILTTRSDMPTLEQLSFVMTLRAEDWHTSLRAAVVKEEFTYLGVSDFRTYGPLSLQSFLVFDPSNSAFSYFSNLMRFELLEASFGSYTYLSSQSSQTYNLLTANFAAGVVRWRADVRTGLCPAEFRTASLRADWSSTGCALDLSAFISFACTAGFERFRLTGTYREVPQLSFGSLVTDFIAELDYELHDKTLSLALRTRTAQTEFCLTPLLDLDLGAAPLSLNAVRVEGIKLECSVGEGVDFYAATSFDATRNTELIGNADFFEVYRLRVLRPGCCGGNTLMAAAFYFDETPASLFDVGLVTASIDVPLNRDIRWIIAMEFPVAADWLIRFGWEWRF